MEDEDLQALIAKAKGVQQISRTIGLAVPLGDKAAAEAASSYNRYNVSGVKKAYQPWMKDAPRTLEELLES